MPSLPVLTVTAASLTDRAAATAFPAVARAVVTAASLTDRAATTAFPAVARRLLDVSLSPNPSQLPGGGTLQQLTDGLGGWALIMSLVGLLIGAAAWAIGVHSQNYHQSFVGRRAVLVSGLAALLIGASPTLINFFFHAGVGLH